MAITGGYGGGSSEGGTGAVNSVNGKTGDVNLTKSDLNLNNVDDTNDIEKPVSTLQQTAINQSLQAAKDYCDSSKVELQEAVDWIADSDLIEAPFVVWVNLENIDLNESISVNPNIVSGTQPFTYEIESGSLPNGITFNSETGEVSGFTSESGTGTVVFKTSNLKDSYTYTLNWTVSLPKGSEEFFNSSHKYPYFICQESDFENLYFVKVDDLLGQINSSFVFDNTENSQVFFHPYSETTGGYNYVYLMQHSTSSYWYAFKSNYAPTEIVNGLDLADNLTSTGYELVAQDSEQVIVDGIKIPVDADINYLTHPNYVEIGNDDNLNGFLSSNNVWSFGFTAVEDLPDDFLGRTLFARENGNFIGYKNMNSTYEYMVFGKSYSSTYYDSISTTVGKINNGDKVQVVFNGSNLEFRVNGILKNSNSLSSFHFESDTITNTKKLNFGKCVVSNVSRNDYQNQYKFLSYFQGMIRDLWIANGIAFNSTQCNEISTNFNIYDSINYVSITHAWQLDEQVGTTFNALKGGITAYGKKNT